MNKTFLRYLGIYTLATALVLGFGWNAQSYNDGNEESKIIVTSKTDRTLIKEIHRSQKEILKLLREIKSMFKEKK